jgi:preprotein translocase subunit SecG
VGVLGTLVLIFHVLVAVAVCGLVLLQHGKGADMGAAFGSGSSGSLFGASGSANFLSRSTALLATLFFLTSLGLTWYSVQKPQGSSVMDTMKTQQPAAPPAAPAPGAGSVPVPQPTAPGDAGAPGDGGAAGDSRAGSIPK